VLPSRCGLWDMILVMQVLLLKKTQNHMEIVTRVMRLEVGYLITPIIIYYFLCAAQRNNIPNVHIMNWWLSCYF